MDLQRYDHIPSQLGGTMSKAKDGDWVDAGEAEEEDVRLRARIADLEDQVNDLRMTIREMHRKDGE